MHTEVNQNLKRLLGLRIKKLRIQNNLTQLELSEYCNTNVRYFSDVEQGKNLISLPVLIKLCNLFKVSPSALLVDFVESRSEKKEQLYHQLESFSEEELELFLKIQQDLNCYIKAVK